MGLEWLRERELDVGGLVKLVAHDASRDGLRYIICSRHCDRALCGHCYSSIGLLWAVRGIAHSTLGPGISEVARAFVCISNSASRKVWKIIAEAFIQEGRGGSKKWTGQ